MFHKSLRVSGFALTLGTLEESKGKHHVRRSEIRSSLFGKPRATTKHLGGFAETETVGLRDEEHEEEPLLRVHKDPVLNEAIVSLGERLAARADIQAAVEQEARAMLSELNFLPTLPSASADATSPRKESSLQLARITAAARSLPPSMVPVAAAAALEMDQQHQQEPASACAAAAAAAAAALPIEIPMVRSRGLSGAEPGSTSAGSAGPASPRSVPADAPCSGSAGHSHSHSELESAPAQPRPRRRIVKPPPGRLTRLLRWLRSCLPGSYTPKRRKQHAAKAKRTRLVYAPGQVEGEPRKVIELSGSTILDGEEVFTPIEGAAAPEIIAAAPGAAREAAAAARAPSSAVKAALGVAVVLAGLAMVQRTQPQLFRRLVDFLRVRSTSDLGAASV